MQNRYTSIFTEDYEHCYKCGRLATDWHHIFNASNKKHSEEYGLMLPLCRDCHNEIHMKLMRQTKAWAQGCLMRKTNITEDEFRNIFGKNYL